MFSSVKREKKEFRFSKVTSFVRPVIAIDQHLLARNRQFDIIVSNPPYVADSDECLEVPVSVYEPALALFSGEDGLNDIRKITRSAGAYLESEGYLILEHGHDQQQAVFRSLQEQGYGEIEAFQDLCGNDRMIQARTAHEVRDDRHYDR